MIIVVNMGIIRICLIFILMIIIIIIGQQNFDHHHDCNHFDLFAITIVIFINFLTNIVIINVMTKINIIVQYDSDRSGPKWLRWELLCITTSAHRGQSQGISMDTGPP